ncbi:alpha/beta hydrolase fold domain-containing protein [Pelagibacterium halotolerans]|uniref:alpha/beta hydrolase fold domain-containing protein n=1 Tax=Pelagibacterium halotolerans TaxID=531813 RepID=UPI003850BAC9
MSTQSMHEQILSELDVCLERFEARAEGSKVWRELYFAQPIGVRALTMTLMVPAGPGPHPLVVYIHGGGWMAGHQNVTNDNLENMKIADNLLAAGYAVARPAYRLSGEAKFPTQLHDCKAAVRYLRHHAGVFNIDPERIGAMGESAGGLLAVMLGLETPAEFEGKVGITGPSSAVKAVVDWYGVIDFLNLDAQALPDARAVHEPADSAAGRLIGGAISDNLELARRASPITWVNARSAPCLIQHGTLDRIVPSGQGIALFDALKAAGVPAELELIEGAEHCFRGVDTSAIMPSVVRFFDVYLRV